MADSYFSSLLSALKGDANPVNPPPIVAPPLTSYPSNDDAQYARQYGFSEGNINQPFLDNQAARVVGHMENSPPPLFSLATAKTSLKNKSPIVAEQKFVPDSAAGLELDQLVDPKTGIAINPKKEGLQGKLDDRFMRAALAVNRNPIAAAGFDPGNTNIDTQIQNPNLGGLTDSQNHVMYSNIRKPTPNSPIDTDSIVHESIHNGLSKLREKYPDQYGTIAKNLPNNEELIVRLLMNNLAGNPEQGSGGAGDKQRDTALNYFKQTAPLDAVNQLQELAIQDRKTKSKRSGPQ